MRWSLRSRGWFGRSRRIISENQKQVNQKILKIRIRLPSPRSCPVPARESRPAPALFLASRRLARARRRLGAQPLDLAPRQGNADLPDPFQFYPNDRLGVETGE